MNNTIICNIYKEELRNIEEGLEEYLEDKGVDKRLHPIYKMALYLLNKIDDYRGQLQLIHNVVEYSVEFIEKSEFELPDMESDEIYQQYYQFIEKCVDEIYKKIEENLEGKNLIENTFPNMNIDEVPICECERAFDEKLSSDDYSDKDIAATLLFLDRLYMKLFIEQKMKK